MTYTLQQIERAISTLTSPAVIGQVLDRSLEKRVNVILADLQKIVDEVLQ